MGGGRNFLLERGNQPEMGGCVDVEMRGLQLFLLLYSSVQSHVQSQVQSQEQP